MFKTSVLLSAFLILCLPTLTFAAETSPIKLLIFGGGTHHEFGKCSGSFIDHLRSKGGFTVYYSEDINSLQYENLKKYNVLLLNCCLYYPNPPDPAFKLPSPEFIQESLPRFVSEGGGLVCVHCSVASFSDWKDKINVLGGIWDWDKSKHDAYQPMNSEVTVPDHPIVKGLPKTFTFPDEFYHTLTVLPSSKILIQGTHDKEGKPVTEPLVWVAKDTEKERVVTILYGHDMGSWGNPIVQDLLRQAVEWSARKR